MIRNAIAAAVRPAVQAVRHLNTRVLAFNL